MPDCSIIFAKRDIYDLETAVLIQHREQENSQQHRRGPVKHEQPSHPRTY